METSRSVVYKMIIFLFYNTPWYVFQPSEIEFCKLKKVYSVIVLGLSKENSLQAGERGSSGMTFLSNLCMDELGKI